MRTLITTIVLAFFMISATSCVATYRHRPAPDVLVIKHKPKNYKVVRIKGKKYYHWDNKHYRKVRGGYIYIRF